MKFLGLFILFLILGVAVLIFDAYLYSVHVPTLTKDPGNLWAWFWVLIATTSILGYARSTKR